VAQTRSYNVLKSAITVGALCMYQSGEIKGAGLPVGAGTTQGGSGPLQIVRIHEGGATVSTVPTWGIDPFEEFLDKFNHDPWWRNFPRWLERHRRNTDRFLPPED
jgi:hypothetical protein